MSFSEVHKQIQPQFPPQYTPENGRIIDWGNCGLVAYATGQCVHLSYVKGKELVHVSSIEVAPYPVSCFKFHLTLRAIAIADIKGRLFLWDLDRSCYIAAAKPLKYKSDAIIAMEWFEDILLVLTSTRRFIAVDFTKGTSSENLTNCTIVWETVLPKQYTRISIDPHYSHLILLSSDANYFGLYYAGSPREKPSLFVDTVELSDGAVITDAQWSLHMPGYIFIILERDIMLFHIQSRSLAPLIDMSCVPATFSFLVQFQSDHTRFLAVHKTGMISIWQCDENMWYSFKNDIKTKMSSGTIVSAAISRSNDDLLVVFSEDQGLGLMSLSKMRIISMDLTFPSNITAYDSDGTRYVTGTDKGYITVGNLFETCEMKRFKVSEEAISFVSLDGPLFRVYWQTKKDLGCLDIVGHSNEVFNSNVATSMKCFGSPRGALIVMRDVSALGVFIRGRESPLLFDSRIADVSVNEDESSQSNGRFCVLLRNLSVIFYRYAHGEGVIEMGRGPALRAVESEPLSIAERNGEYVIGFSSGLFIFVNTKTGMSRRVISEYVNIRDLTYSKTDSGSIFGLCKGRTLFEYNNGKFRTYPYEVESFKVISESLLLIKGVNGVVKFINVERFEPLSYTSNYLPVPSEDEMIKDFITSNPSNCYNRLARDAWLIATGQTNLRLQAVAGTSPTGLAERMNYALLSRTDIDNSDMTKMRFFSLIFQNRVEEAVTLYQGCETKEPDFLANTLTGVFLLLTEKSITERARTHLGVCAKRAFASNNYDDGILLMRMGKLDKEAAHFLIDKDKRQLAMRFIRSTVPEEDRKTALFRLGVLLYNKNNLTDAIPILSASGEWHAVLFVLFTMGLIADVHFLFEYLREHNMLKSCTEEQHRIFHDLQQFDELCALIERQYELLLARLGLT